MTVEMPPDEAKRLKTLRDLNILDTASEAKFDELLSSPHKFAVSP